MRVLIRALSARRGFSLPELMIAIALSSLVLLAAGLVIDNAVSGQKQVVDRDRAQGDIRLVQSYLQTRLPVAVLPLRQAGDTQVEFLTYAEGKPRYIFVGRSCTDGPALVSRAANTPLAASYPPSAPSQALSSMQRLMSVGDCESDPVTFQYRNAAGSLISDADGGRSRATDTRSVSVTLKSPIGYTRTLQFAVGIDTADEARTRIDNGDFELPASPPTDPPEAWTAGEDGAVTRPDEPGRGLVAELSDGAELQQRIGVVEGETLQADIKAGSGATCSLGAYAEGEPDPEAVVTSDDTSWGEPKLLEMSSLIGRSDITLRISAAGGSCSFDGVRTADDILGN